MLHVKEQKEIYGTTQASDLSELGDKNDGHSKRIDERGLHVVRNSGTWQRKKKAACKVPLRDRHQVVE